MTKNVVIGNIRKLGLLFKKKFATKHLEGDNFLFFLTAKSPINTVFPRWYFEKLKK